MLEQSLDLSLIRPQTNEKAKQTLFDKDASLENILDELDRRADSPLKKKNSPPYIEIPKNPVAVIRSTQNKPSITTTADNTPVSSDYDRYARKAQTTRRESKLLVVQENLPTPIRPSIELLHDVPGHPGASPNQVMEGDSPTLPPNMQRRGSNLLGSNLGGGLIHVRRMSSPNALGVFQSQVKLIPISSSMVGSQTSLIPNLSQVNMEPRFNVCIPEKAQVASPPKLKLVTGYSMTNSPKSPYMASPGNNHPKIESPMQQPINSDYLMRVLQKSGLGSHSGSHGGSHPGSNVESPRSEGNSNHDGFRNMNLKRGSFSVFRKVVEAEILKNP